MMYKILYFHGYGGSYFIFSAMGFGRFWVWVWVFWVCAWEGYGIWEGYSSGGVVLGKGNVLLSLQLRMV
jgi:hypothetical protein